MLWLFFVEFEEKGFDCNPRLGFGLVLIRGSDEGRLSLPSPIGLRLVIPELQTSAPFARFLSVTLPN